MRVCLIIIAFGEPRSDLKLRILDNNIQKIKQFSHKLDIHLNLYTQNQELKKKILKIDPNIVINESKGYLLELLFKFNDPEKYKDYDHIILLLDDVEIINVDFNDLFQAQKKYELDIIGPRIKNANHDMVDKYTSGLYYLVNMEFFMYIFTAQSYKKYFEHFNKKHKTMWGYDFCLFYKSNLKVAINYKYVCQHHLRTSGSRFEGSKELAEVQNALRIEPYRQVNPIMLLDDGENHFIKRAYYGSKDVTDKVRKLYDNGVREIECSNDVFGDSDVGFNKYLVILYKQNDKYIIDVALEKKYCKLAHHKNMIKI
jgi:hypothetical protein